MMKKFIKSLVSGSCLAFLLFNGDCWGMNQTISYHLFLGSPSRMLNEIPTETRSKLERDLSIYNERFQKSACTQLKYVANSLLDDYKKIFANNGDATDESLENIFSQEKRVFADISIIDDASDKICETCHGLPEASLRLESMYETLGLYKVALLWAHVSHKLGFSQAKEDASRLLLMINK